MTSEYRVLARIGGGAFGDVYKGIHCESGQIVAMKRIAQRPVERGAPPMDLLRELHVLASLSHSNVLPLFDSFYVGRDLVLVTEFMAGDLGHLMRASPRPIGERASKLLMRMLLEGLRHMHAKGVMHRDIKPANLLLSDGGVLRIADMGLARHLHGAATDSGRRPPASPGSGYSPQVATRWYRAPELLFGARRYGPPVDLWAAGCVMAEMLTGAPLFRGTSDIDQIATVMEVKGSPSLREWPDLEHLPDYGKIEFPKVHSQPLGHVVRPASEAALDLLSGLLRYNPADRLTAEEALGHPWFAPGPERAASSLMAVLALSRGAGARAVAASRKRSVLGAAGLGIIGGQTGR